MRGWMRRVFGRRRGGVYAPAPGHQSRSFAAALSGVVGSSLIWCSCGRLLAPIVFSDGEQAVEIVALACCDCERSLPVAVGVLIGDQEPAAPQ
jgi:hypothetical protein